MFVNPIAFLSCYNATAYLIEALLLSTCLANCGITSIKDGAIPAGEDWIRPETTIPQGTLRGINMVTHLGRRFFGFKGIPFAEPPIGDLRFKQAVPAGPWNGILDAGNNPNACIQREDELIGDEDCLYLNVYTPQIPKSENSTLLPVMVFIYGGQFRFGVSNPERWGPQFILNKDVVLLVPNYRFGILGFLTTGDEVSPGNNHLKDIVQALKWAQENIKYFGGDPDQVTIFGGSAGAIAIHYLTLSPLTEGLFHRYMTHSGSALSPIAPEPWSVAAARVTKLGEYLGCPIDTSTALVNCLRSFNGSYLYDTEIVLREMKLFDLFSWVPVVEPDVEGAMLTDTPANLIAAGKKRVIPWVLLVTRDEGIVLTAVYFDRPDLFQETLNDIDSLLLSLLKYDTWAADVAAHTSALKSFYNLTDPTADRKLLLKSLTLLLTDALIMYPVYKEVQQHLPFVTHKSPVYLCSFNYRGTFSYSYKFSGGNTEDWGASHGDELIYLLPGPKTVFGPPGYEYSQTDLRMVDTMVELWTSFATNGIPASTSDSVIWEPYSSLENYLQIGNGPDSRLEVKNGFHTKRMQFWERFHAATL
ncbi:juvenile hormone esterase-like [Neodiprion virginianus]|uniref:juvenile hormone esterase-like n=1 Tax=Neodiprion virginianus TaxID=2961670 RepID=UPI001EE72907|nr:juvenile hormone esterase-like [Neodiprion virginianus]